MTAFYPKQKFKAESCDLVCAKKRPATLWQSHNIGERSVSMEEALGEGAGTLLAHQAKEE